MSNPSVDTIDLADVARSLRRGRWIILGSVVAGLALALVVIVLSPRRFIASASAVVRAASESGSSLLAKAAGDLTGLGGMTGLGGSELETEMQILQSAAVLGSVSDSLHLQVVSRKPAGLPSDYFVRDARLPGLFKPLKLQFEHTRAGAYHVSGHGVDTTVPGGGTVATPVGSVVLRERLPDRFALTLLDREDAIQLIVKGLVVKKPGGNVLRVSYETTDSVTAAAVPNLALSEYLRRKKTSDRGVNARRAEALAAQLDSVSLQLAQREDALRRFQERSGLIDPETVGKIELDQAASLRRDLGAVEVEATSMDRLLSNIGSGAMTARQLVTFPTFLKSPAINSLLQQVTSLETERTRLLERRTEQDPEVVALTRSIAEAEGQLVPLARSYQASLRQQRAALMVQLGTLTAQLGGFPGSAQEGARLLRDVKRLSTTQGALQTQLVQAQLSAVGEGGDVRMLDVATISRTPIYPRPLLTAAVGAAAGLVLGVLLALLRGSHGKYFEGPVAIERTLGVPAIRFDPTVPLLMSGRASVRTLLLVPVEASVDTGGVAERLAETALARGETATIFDLTGRSLPVRQGRSIGAELLRLEEEHELVVVRLPGLSGESTAAALSGTRPVLLLAPARRIERRALIGALDTLRRLGVPCAGIVLNDEVSHGALPG